MLTKMTEEDWVLVLEVFHACRSRRGDKGRDDRKFFEALHYFTVHNITWRALPAEFGSWNSIWKRFWRLSRSGVFETFFEALAALSERAHLVQMFELDRHPRACVGGRRKRGQDGEALGRSRGGFSTKIHLKTDLDGYPIGFHLTGGEASDSRNFEVLLALGPDVDPRAVVADKGYDAKTNREAATLRAIHRGYVDDTAPAAVDHAIHDLFGHVEDRVEIGANDRIPVGLAHFLERGIAGYTRVVDQNVDGSDLFGNPCDALLAGIEIRNVDRVCAEFATAGLVFGDPFLGFRVGGRMGNHNPVAGRVHFRADRIAKPAHSARDYCNAHECPPCLNAEVNEFSGVMSQTLSPTRSRGC